MKKPSLKAIEVAEEIYGKRTAASLAMRDGKSVDRGVSDFHEITGVAEIIDKSFPVPDPEIEFINFTGNKETEASFSETVMKVAKFIGADRVVYKDGKDEQYEFYKAGKKLKLTTGHDVQPRVSFLCFEIEE